MNDKPLYNMAIINAFLGYLREHHPDVDTDVILAHAGIPRRQLEDIGAWFTQAQADRFFAKAAELSGDPDLARKAGRHGVTSGPFALLRQYLAGLVTPEAICSVAGHLYNLWSRGTTVTTRRIGTGRVELIAIPPAGIQEQPFQCDNRLGTLEALAESFSGRARVEHPECLHRGGSRCRYVISSTPPRALSWRRVRTTTWIAGLAAFALSWFFLPAAFLLPLGLGILALDLGLGWITDRMDRRGLRRNVTAHAETVEQLLLEINSRHQDTLLLQEIGTTAANILDTDELIRAVLDIMEKRLPFAAGLILLADETALVPAGDYGLSPASQERLHYTRLPIDDSGKLTRCFREQLHQVLPAGEPHKLSEVTGEPPLLCVPVMCEQRSIGLLLVQTAPENDAFDHWDVSLLAGIAQHLAASIHNARSFKRLRRSEDRYRMLFDTMLSGFALFRLTTDNAGNPSGFRYLEANPQYAELINFRREDLIGRSFSEVFPTEKNTWLDLARRVTATRTPAHVVRRARSLDKELEVIIFSPRAGEVACMVMDITERRDMEERLRRSEQNFRELVQNAHNLILRLDAAGHITFVNNFAADFFGAVPKDLRGRQSTAIFFPEHAEDAPQDLVSVSRGVVHREIATTTSAGEQVWISWTFTPMHNEAGGVSEVLCIGNDISARKTAEEDKERLEAQLQRAQKMEVVGALAGGVAHDLNNILSGIVSYPDLLLTQLPDDSPLVRPLKTIRRSGERAAAIVQDLLTLARRGVEVHKACNLNPVIEDYLTSPEFNQLRQLHPGVTFIPDLDPAARNVTGSPIHLAKMLMNLVTNAAEAMQGGGSVTITTAHRYVDAPVRGYDSVHQGDYVILSVSDTGCGINEEDLAHIFEPFYTKKVMGRSGTGLGMAVVWNTVKDHHGYLDVISEPGHGTTIHIYLPTTADALPRLPHPTDLSGQHGTEAILVIDDVSEQRDLASELLTTLGYTITTAPGGEEAIKLLETTSFDLLILDMIMDPGIDGLETYRQALKLHPGQKAVIASGFSESDRVRQALNLGAHAYVKKPYSLADLATAVRSALDEPRELETAANCKPF